MAEWEVLCTRSSAKGVGTSFPFPGFFSEKGKRYSRDLVENVVLSPLTISCGVLESEFKEINRRIEVGARWSDEGIERRVARLLEEVRLNGPKFGF